MGYCLLCKEMTDDRYVIKVKDNKTGQPIRGSVCRYCYNKFIDSKNDKGFFKINRFRAWAREKKDRMRYI